ncbi:MULTISPECIES: hypothetical protein [Photorhabdus]|uniref:Uncharacterized protein n=1 Tax=Photorhabdus asymbiotica subsp. asymbiotica (strain ATCC 43949 / 3105-77) TaxID=553480 RepID=C7BJG3_PHOAA|nr:hypothetical protein [Photorhabdus asymbiotica]CAQ85488.1 Hypothetical Protein PAU_03400 [Photorhabdus asymbiotica]
MFGSDEINFSKLAEYPKTNERLTSIRLHDLNCSLGKIWLNISLNNFLYMLNKKGDYD